MHTWDTLDTLTMQSHDIISITVSHSHPDNVTQDCCQTILMNVFPNQSQYVKVSCSLNPSVHQCLMSGLYPQPSSLDADVSVTVLCISSLTLTDTD